MREGTLSVDRLSRCVRAFDLDAASIARSKSAVQQVLGRFGLCEDDARRLSDTWVVQADFLFADVPHARWVVGNPPYVRASLIPREQREAYGRELSCVTLGSDLYVGFFEKCLRALTSDGTLWLHLCGSLAAESLWIPPAGVCVEGLQS